MKKLNRSNPSFRQQLHLHFFNKQKPEKLRWLSMKLLFVVNVTVTVIIYRTKID